MTQPRSGEPHLFLDGIEDSNIRAGMKVLDVGCGPGDVSLIAAELVGEEGLVIGVDTNASVLDIAQAASLRQVSFLARLFQYAY